MLLQATHVGDSRPTGVVQPTHERAVRALTALAQKRIDDAEKHIAALPDSPMTERAWKLFLRGLVSVEKPDLGAAEPLLLQAFSLAFADGHGGETSKRRNVETSKHQNVEMSKGRDVEAVDGDALRLAALVFQHLGWVYRRQDRLDDAYRTHVVAYHLREHHGSFDELWETAGELGLDADVARQYEKAHHWHRVAIEAAQNVSQDRQRKQAIACTNLSTSLTNSGKHDEAVEAARRARVCWREHDAGAVTVPRSNLKLGSTLLAQGEALHDLGDRLAKSVLDEAVELLATAGEELLAFGPANAADARLCLEQKDFARRLLDSL